MRKPLTRDDYAYLFFYSVMACVLTVPIGDLAKAIDRNTEVYRKYTEVCPLPGTIPEKPTGNFWILKWVDARKERR